MSTLYKIVAAVAISLVASAAFASTAATPAPSQVWEKLGERDGVEIFSKPPTADGVVSFKGIAVMDASADDVVSAMRDNRTAARWMPMVGERYTLREQSATRRVEYTHMKMPWPATDRYFVSSSEVMPLGNGELVVVVESVDPKDKEFEAGWMHANKVLATFHHSEFRVRPLDERRSELSFEVRTSAGGAVPTWLVSMGQKNWPRDFVVKLRDELARRR